MRKEGQKNVIKCGFCTHFFNSVKRYVNSIGDSDPKSRLCSEKGEFVTEKTEACNRFEKYDKFWCVKNNFWIAFEVCKQRRLSKRCKSCKQKKQIMEIEEYEERKERIKSFRRGENSANRTDSDKGSQRGNNRSGSSFRNS